MTTKKKNALFGRYPCCDLVNNAIRFILEGKTDEAIEELWFAIHQAGGYVHDDIAVKAIEAKDRVWAKRKS